MLRLSRTLIATVALLAPRLASAQDPAVDPALQQCPADVAVTCPARREITLIGGWAPESYSVGIAWTGVKRLGAYVRVFPGLDPSPRSSPNTTTNAESIFEFGLAYRVTAPITLGVGVVKHSRTETEYGGIDTNTGRPTLVARNSYSKVSPALFIAYAFHPPQRAIGLAASASAGIAGYGAGLGVSLRFPTVRAPIGVP
jgi:hypothetical protein